MYCLRCLLCGPHVTNSKDDSDQDLGISRRRYIRFGLWGPSRYLDTKYPNPAQAVERVECIVLVNKFQAGRTACCGAFRGGGEGGTIPMEVDTPTSTSTTTQAAATPGTSRTLIPSTSPIQQGPDPGLSTCVTDVSGSSSRRGRSGARGRAQGGRGRGGHEREQQRRGRGSGPPVVRPEAMVRGRGDRVEARAEARARQLSAGSGTCPGRCVATAERSGGPVGN